MEGEQLSMDNIRVRAVIEGIVQGVWFRESTRREAQSLGVNGWVRNRRDGAVELVAEGPRDKVEALVKWCRRGPPSARVERVDVTEESWRGEFDTFFVAR
jgi:acylphosphatase